MVSTLSIPSSIQKLCSFNGQTTFYQLFIWNLSTSMKSSNYIRSRVMVSMPFIPLSIQKVWSFLGQTTFYQQFFWNLSITMEPIASASNLRWLKLLFYAYWTSGKFLVACTALHMSILAVPNLKQNSVAHFNGNSMTPKRR